jgi:hypothetical protein
LLAKNNLAETRTCLHLFFGMKILKDSKEDIANLIIRLAIHDVIPIGVLDFLLADLSIGL